MLGYSRRHNTPKLLALGAALSACVAGLGYAALQAYATRSADRFGCFAHLPQAQTHVLVDASIPRWNDEQQRSLRRYLDRAYEKLPFNERLSVYTTEGDAVGSIATPRFHVCGQAGSAAELRAVNAAGATSGYLRKQRARLYERVLAPELEALLSAQPDEARVQRYQSPILEMIADVSRTAIAPGDRLILISDLLQHSDSAKFCRVRNDMPPFAAFKRRRIYQRLKPEPLEGIEIEVLMLQRAGYGQTGLGFCRDEEELRDFWRDYFLDNGAASVRFIRIRHGYTAG